MKYLLRIWFGPVLRKCIKLYQLNLRRLLEISKSVILLSRVTLDKNTFLEGRNKIYENTNIESSFIGYSTYVGPNTLLNHTKTGKYCSIGPRVRVVQGFHPSNTHVSTFPAFFSVNKQGGYSFVNKNCFEEYKYIDKTKNIWIEIGNDVWIGSDVIILAGIRISTGAIIASGAVITKDIGPYEIWGGNPARFLKKRFTDEQINYLLKIKWWNLDFGTLKVQSDKFQSIEDYMKTKSSN